METDKKARTVYLEPIPNFLNDILQEGWTLQIDNPIADNNQLLLCNVFRDHEAKLKGRAILERANSLSGCAGQQHLERLLMQPRSFPAEWNDYDLIFPGTRWHRDNSILFPTISKQSGVKKELFWGRDYFTYGSSARIVLAC